MIKSRLRSSVALGALAVGLTAVAPQAIAQPQNYTYQPFFDWTVDQSRAIGLELAAQRLRIVMALEPPYDDEFAEVVENLTGPDWQRFAGTLAEADEEFAEELHEILDEIAEGIEDGEDVEDLVPQALEMLAQAYDMVIPADLQNDTAFQGGVMAQLLLGEGGVAEGLEEAFEEEWEYANGWAATQRIKVLWSGISDMAGEQMQADVEEAIAAFDAIYPSPEPPDSFAGTDPEEAETPAQRMVGFLETVVDAQLYSGRNQAVLIAHLEELAVTGCDHYEAGEDELGREVMYAVFDHYAGETTGLGDLIGLFAPEVNEEAQEAFESLVIVEDDDDDDDDDDGDDDEDDAMGDDDDAMDDDDDDAMDDDDAEEAGDDDDGEGDDDDDDDDEGEAAMGGTEACEALVEALGEGRAVLGG